MIQHGERTRAGTTSRIGAWLQRKHILLRDEVSIGSPDLARVGLVALALVFQTIVVSLPGHFRPAEQPIFAVLVVISTLASLALCLAATLPVERLTRLHTRQLLGIAAFVSLAILPPLGMIHAIGGIGAMVEGRPYSNDGAIMDLYAADQVRHGRNPYHKTNIVTALARVNAPSTTTTPLIDGQFRGARSYPSAVAVEQVFLNVLRYRPRTIPPEFESKYNYPAGSFLFILPFVWAGMHDMRFLYALAIALMGAYLWFRMPRHLRILVPLIVLGNVSLIASAQGGQPDPLYGLFLMIGYAEWRRPWLSSGAFGLAVATKQLAWFFLPFYLVLIVQKYGWREACRRCGIMTLIFVITNGYFIAQSPQSYIASIAGPMTDPMFPLGVGVMAIFVSNVVPMAPKLAFTVAELCVWAASVYSMVRLRYFTLASGAVLGALPLFFAWRSLTTYFYLVPLFALAFTLANAAEPAPRVAE